MTLGLLHHESSVRGDCVLPRGSRVFVIEFAIFFCLGALTERDCAGLNH